MKTSCQLLILVVIMAVASPAFARILRVNCNLGETISQALQQARPRDTIRIWGTCNETVTITTDRLTLEGRLNPTIDGGGGSQPVIDVVGVQGVTIMRLTVQNGNSGIRGRDGAALTLDNVTVQNNLAVGINIQRNSTATLTSTIVSSNNGDDGLAIEDSSSILADSSSALTTRNNTGDGLRVSRASARLSGTTTATGNGAHGVNLVGSSASLSGTTLLQNNGRDGIIVNGSHLRANGTLSILSNADHGLNVGQGSSVGLFDGTMVIDGNTSDGILVLQNSVIRLARSVGTFSIQIRNNGQRGIHINRQSSGFLQSGTTISGNADNGLQVRDNSSVVVINTSITGNSGDGMDVDDGSANVSNSTITGHGTDVRATFGSRLTLNGNTIGTISCDGTVLSRGAIVCP